jgi:NH3-dependent NAD+ synthetase
MDGFDTTLNPALGADPSGVTAENLQSRIRGTLLMAVANQQGQLLLTTGNKSELAVGYCTLYGDMNGGLAVIGDLYKTSVFALCDWLDSPASQHCRKEYHLARTRESWWAKPYAENPRALNFDLIKKTATRCRTTAFWTLC